jgi:hypothetical protein
MIFGVEVSHYLRWQVLVGSEGAAGHDAHQYESERGHNKQHRYGHNNSFEDQTQH